MTLNEVKNNNSLNGTDASAPLSAHPRGYSAAFEEIWRTHFKQILRVTQRITKNREDAEDALQDSFLRAYLYLHTFDGRSSLTTWLTRIAINSALMILRKRASAPHLSIDDSGCESAKHPQFVNLEEGRPGPEAQYAQFEEQAILRLGIRMLRPTIRQALELQVLNDHSIQETAEKMGLSISATKSRLFHAKAALRRSLEPKTGGRGLAAGRLRLSPA